MNKVILIGNLTKDPDIKYGNNNTAYMKAQIAVQRKYKNSDGKYDADFITLSIFGGTAEFVEKHFHKGSKIVVEGEWRTGSYEDKNGNKVYTNECVVNSVEFGSSKNDNADNGNQQTISEPSTPEPQETNHNRPAANTSSDDDFINIDESATGDIPFFG
jgi:single-strand DNA-binding protein